MLAISALAFGARTAAAWVSQAEGSGGPDGDNKVRAVAIDGPGDVIAAGRLKGDTSEFAVAKFDGATGAEVWVHQVPGSDGNDIARALAVDGSGNVIAAGDIWSGSDRNFVVIKLLGVSGQLLWRTGLGATNNSVHGAMAVAVNGSGDVFVAGSRADGVACEDFYVVKLSGSSGAVLWEQSYSGTNCSKNEALALTLDGSGDVIAAGYLESNVFVVKLSGATGSEIWSKEINGSANSGEQALAVTVDGSGDAIAAGILADSRASDFFVIKLTGLTGQEEWRRVINGLANATDAAYDVAVDGSGDVVAVGEFRDTGTNGNFAVVKLSGASGSELWRQEFGQVDTFDSLRSVGIDGSGDVFVGGQRLLAKFSSTGLELWRNDLLFNIGAAEGRPTQKAVAVDASNDVIAGGLSFTVAKFHGLDGSDFPPGICGNSVLEPGEECDDGNNILGDGCSAACQVEPPDVDGDGVPDATDNCPELINPSQTDSDSDLIGDLCDSFPADPDNEQAQCEADLNHATTDLSQCEADLTSALADPRDADGDGESDSTDVCPTTLEGEPVDSNGCSLSEFCMGIDASTTAGAKICRMSDWLNDEPTVDRPEDCQMQKRKSEQDLCIGAL